MRALLIDKTGIRALEFDGSLEAMYTLIGCRLVDGAGYPNPTHAAWVDDEGMLDLEDGTQATRVSWYPHTLAGRILVTGFDPDTGETTAATLSVTELRSMVKIGQFVNREE